MIRTEYHAVTPVFTNMFIEKQIANNSISTQSLSTYLFHIDKISEMFWATPCLRVNLFLLISRWNTNHWSHVPAQDIATLTSLVQ